MRTNRIVMLLCAALLGPAAAAPTPPASYRFTLDGESITPEITPVFGDEDAPAPGDVVKIGDFLMVLGKPGDHAFRIDGECLLLGKLPGMGAEACVAVQIKKTTRKNKKWGLVDPLSPMTAAEKTQLRGVTIRNRPDDLDRSLAGIHWEHTVLLLNYSIKKQAEILPPLPPDLRYLHFDLQIHPIEDVRSLSRLRKLAYLCIDSRMKLDLSQLTCGPELRFFDNAWIGGATLTHLEAIAGWTFIRNLNLRNCEELSDIEFLRGLGELRILNLSRNNSLRDIGPIASLPKLSSLTIDSWKITDLSPVAGLSNLTHLNLDGTQVSDLSPVTNLSKLTSLGLSYTEVTDLAPVANLSMLTSLRMDHTKVADLSPIGRLSRLERLDADDSAVETLPSNPVMPSLRRATMLSAPASPEAEAAFQAAVPQCRIRHTLEGTLLNALAGADRIRARTGGTCHRNIKEEKTIFEISGTKQVREFLQGIRLVEPEGVGACMCCGDPTFEIYRGEELMTTLGLHHATSLRWSGDDDWWPGDIELTDTSAAYLCKLLAEQGYAGPLARHERQMRWKAQNEKHRNACLAFITAEQFDRWLEVYRRGEEGDLEKLVRESLPGAAERTATIYALYGALPDDPWHIKQYFDRITKHLFETVDPDALHTILARDDCPEQILQGVTRRIFGDWHRKIASTLPDLLFEKLADWALRHPAEYNRRETVDDLAEMKTERANRIIVRFLRDSPQPLKSNSSDGTEPKKKPFKYTDPIVYDDDDPFAPKPTEPLVKEPNPFVVPEGASEPVAAAILLAQHGYPDALTEIRKLAAKTEGEERKVLEAAAAVLAKPDKR